MSVGTQTLGRGQENRTKKITYLNLLTSHKTLTLRRITYTLYHEFQN